MRSGAFFYAVEAMHSIFCALENVFHVRKKVKHVCLARSFLLPLPSHAGSDVERFMQQLIAYAHDAASGKKQAIVLPVGRGQLFISSRALTQYGDASSLNVLFAAMHAQGYAMRVSEGMNHARIVCTQLHALWKRPVSIQGVSSGARQSADRLMRTLWMALQSSPVLQDSIIDASLKTTRYLVHDALPLLITLVYIYQSMSLVDDAFGVYWLAWRFTRYPFMQNAYSVAFATLWSSMHILFFLSQARWSLDYQTLLFVANVATVLLAARRFYHYRQSVTHTKWLSDRTLLVGAMLRVCDQGPRKRLSSHGFDAIHDPRSALVFAAYVIIASCSLHLGDNTYAHTMSLQMSHVLARSVLAAFYTFAWYIALVAWKEWVADDPRLLNQWLAKKHSMANDEDSLVCMSYQAVRLLKELSFSAQGILQLIPAKQPFLLALQVKNTRDAISPSITGIYDAAFGHSKTNSRGHVVTCLRVRRWLHLSEEALTLACSSAYLQGTSQANKDATGAFYRKELSGFLQVLHASRAISEHVKFSQGLSDVSIYLRMIHACIHADPDALSWMQALYAPNASVSKQRMARELELFLALYVLKISVGTDADRTCRQMQWTADFFWGEVFVTAAVLRIAIERGFCPQRANAQAFDEIIDIVSWLCGLQHAQHAPSWQALACSVEASVLSERLLQLRQSYGPCVRTWGVIDTHYSYAQLSKDVDAMVQSLTKTYVVFSITQPILAGKRAVFIPNRSWSVLWKPRLSLMDRLRQLRLCCFPQSTWTGSRLEVSWQSILLKKQYVDSVWLYVVTCLRARWVYGCAVKELQLICMHAAIARQSFARWRCMQRSPARAVKKSAKDAVLRRGVTHAKSIMRSMLRCLGLLPRLLISVVADASFWLAMASTTACYDGSLRAASGIRACAASAMRVVVSNPLRVFCAATLGLCVASVVMVAQPFVGYGALGVACMIGAVGLWNLVLGGRGVANGAMLKPSATSKSSVTAVPVIRHGASAIAMQVSSSQLLATAVPAAAPQGVSQGSAPGVAQGIAG